MKFLHLSFQIQKFRVSKRNLRIKFQMYPRTLKIHQKNYLKFLLPKANLLATKKRYKKTRTIKLLPRLLEKA